jgi:Family of unknown function (DUF6387)
VLSVAEELDTSWFDLKNYDVFKSMSIEDWENELYCRYLYFKTADYYENHYLYVENHEEDENLLEFLKQAADCIKEGKYHCFISENTIPPQSSVNDFTVKEAWRIAHDHRYQLMLFDKAEGEKLELSNKPFGYDYPRNSAIVNINLAATDEQIKLDFKNWLEKCRGTYNFKSQKKLFTQTDFDYWINYGVIPYLDLLTVAKIEGKKITQNKIARLIFPDEYEVDIVGRLRQVTKPQAEHLIENKVHEALLLQLGFEKKGRKNIPIHPDFN